MCHYFDQIVMILCTSRSSTTIIMYFVAISALSRLTLFSWLRLHRFSAIMPGYHALIGGGEPIDADGIIILASERPGDYKVYEGGEPFDYFPSLPVDSYATIGSWSGTIDELYSKLDKEFRRYFVTFVYRSYDTPVDNMLDMYYYGSQDGKWRFYKLALPMDLPAGVEVYPDAPWPQPCHWYYGTRLRFQHYSTYEDADSAYGESDSDGDAPVCLPIPICRCL